MLVATDSTPIGAVGQSLEGGLIRLEPLEPPSLQVTLTHELAHRFLSEDERWSCLPPIVEEGVADVVAGTVLRRYALSLEFYQRAQLPTGGSADSARRAIRSILTEEMYAQGDPRARELRAIGFVIARRLGIERLRALCAEAQRREHDRIPAEWLLEACAIGEVEEAGLWLRVLGEADPDGWTRFRVDEWSTLFDPTKASTPAVVPQSR